MNALMPLWRIEQDLEELLDTLDVCPPHLRDELEQRIAAYIGAETQKVDRSSEVFTELEARQVAARTEIERLRERAQAAERASQRLESCVLSVLHKRDGRPQQGHNHTLSIRRTEALAIVNPELVPDKFKRSVITIDVPKAPIKEALKAGEEVPGVALQVNEHLVRK